MDIKLVRQFFTANSTIGQLSIDGRFECWTLEDVVRPVKVFGETAIPAGSYQVVISMSNRFKTRLPLLVDVPGFTGVRIHPGNTQADTLGCILVGQSQATDRIGASRAAFAALMPQLEAAAATEKIRIEIVDAGVAALPVATRGRRKPVAAEPIAAAAAPRPAARGRRGSAPEPAQPALAGKGPAATGAKTPTAKPPTAKPSTPKGAASKHALAKKTLAKKIAAKKATAKPSAAKKARPAG